MLQGSAPSNADMTLVSKAGHDAILNPANIAPLITGDMTVFSPLFCVRGGGSGEQSGASPPLQGPQQCRLMRETSTIPRAGENSQALNGH